MTTGLRALIAELADELDHNRQCLMDDRRLTHPLADKARAALAETDGPAVPEGREPASVTAEPSDEELLELASAELANSPNWREDGFGSPFPYEAPSEAWLGYARAVLARWGGSGNP